MLKGVMMSVVLSIANAPTDGATAANTQVVNALIDAGKQSFSGPYTVTVKKVEPVAGSNQVQVTFFVTGDDDPAHDFTETGNQVVTAFLNGGMQSVRANVAGAPAATVEKIEAVEGGDDDSDDDSDSESNDVLSDVLPAANASSPSPASTTSTPPTPPAAPSPDPSSTGKGEPEASDAGEGDEGQQPPTQKPQ